MKGVNALKAEAAVNKYLKTVLDSIQDIPGVAMEFGVYEGGTTVDIAKLLGRITYAWDTFLGMPDDRYDSELDKSDPPGKWKPLNDPIREFEEYNTVCGCDIRPVVGKFSDTIPTFNDSTPIAFVHIDCDNYYAYTLVLEFITPRMTPGGLVVIDDYGCFGAKKAVDEWFARTGRTWEDEKIHSVRF